MTLLSSALPLSLLALFACAATRAVRGYALRSLLDLPNARSSHRVPTPRGGGLGIVVAFSAAVAVLCWQGRVPFEFLMALLGALPMAGIGFLDDHGHVPARWRFLVHVGCAAWALWWLGGLGSVTLAGGRYELGWAGNLLGGFLIVWVLNLLNFMDGIDGIAGTEAITACLSAAWLMPADAASVPVLLALAAATAGFLAWNWPPAKIFMGDVGSGFVGFLLGVLAVRSAIAGELSLAVWLILLGVFFVDATVTLLRRMASGQRWYEAHRSHAYQHAALRLGSHKSVTLAVLAINLLWLLPLAVAAVAWPRWELAFLLLAHGPLAVLALKLDAGKS
jgi:Fuc2NAc and GlcNAc transferase